jgi:hypothetical protein
VAVAAVEFFDLACGVEDPTPASDETSTTTTGYVRTPSGVGQSTSREPVIVERVRNNFPVVVSWKTTGW